MQHMMLFEGLDQLQIVNVSSIPKRSLFRYPGGKTWLVPYIRRWLSIQVRQQFNLLPTRSTHLFEPFAGGGIVGLTAAAELLVDNVTIVELDEDVAAVWETVLNQEDWKWLAQEIIKFDLTLPNVNALLERTDLTLKEKALKTIIRNRVNRGGILAPGAGLLKEGENGKGLKSRWYPQTLAKRIGDIAANQDRISFVNGDGLETIENHLDDADTVFFIDPPYTVAGKKAGKRLYKHSQIDHNRLFELMSRVKGDFLMTYDNIDAVSALAEKHGFDTVAVPMKNTHHQQTTELLIGPDLSWVRALINVNNVH